MQQFFRFGRNRAEAVFEAGTESIHILVECQSVQLAIEQHTLAAASHVIGRQQKFEVAFHLAFVHKLLATDDASVCFQFFGIKVGKLVGLQFVHSFGENLLIRLVA